MKFFLSGITETAQKGIRTFDAILQLQKRVERELQSLDSRAGKAQMVVQHLYKRPVVRVDQVSEIAEVSMPTAYKLVDALEELDILTEITGKQRNRVYMFREYINLFVS